MGESRVVVGPRFRGLLEAIAARAGLTDGKCRLEANFDDGKLRDVLVQSRVGGTQVERLVADEDVDELLGELV